MTDVILVLNAGSSTIKFAMFPIESSGLLLRYRGQIEDKPHP